MALPKTNEPPLMLEVQIDVTPAGATVNAAERKPDGVANDLDAKNDEGADSAAAKADESKEEADATKADDKEDARRGVPL